MYQDFIETLDMCFVLKIGDSGLLFGGRTP